MLPVNRKVILLITIVICLTAVASMAADPEKINPNLKEVIVVFKTHFDIGYTELASEVINRYRTTMIDQALLVCDQSRDLPPEQQFVWTIPGWPLSQILWEGQDAGRRSRVMAAFKDKHFVVHALPFTTHTESLELEDLVRGMGFSSRLSREAGLELPHDAKMTDVASHSWVIPTLLKHAGVDFLHLGCNSVCSSPDVPTLFWWEGPDGSRLLTMYSAGDYGSGLIPPKEWPYKTWLALMHTGDNQGPPKPETIKKLLEEAKVNLPGVTVRMGRLSDFGDAIQKEKPELPVIRGDMTDTWIHGINSMPIETKIIRNIRPQISALESLNTLLPIWGVAVKPAAEAVAKAYENSLLFGEHTWGYNTAHFGQRVYGKEWEDKEKQGVYKRLEDSWAEKGNYVYTAEKLVKNQLGENLKILAQSINTNGGRIAVYNPLPWKRDGIVEIELPNKPPSALRDAETGTIVPVDKNKNSISFIVNDVPSMGYRTYIADESTLPDIIMDLKADSKTNTLENHFFKIVLDPKQGGISSFVDKQNHKELVKNDGKNGFGHYLYERFSKKNVDSYLASYLKKQYEWAYNDLGKPNLPSPSEAPYSAFHAANAKIDFHQNKNSASAVMTFAPVNAASQQISIVVTIYSGQPYMDLTWSITGKNPDPWPESGWLCFPFAIENPQFRLGRLGSIVDPSKDIVRSSNHDIYCLNSGMAILDPTGDGIGLCSKDTPLVSLGHPGQWQYTRDYQPSDASVYVNLFNNAWSTNFQQWIGGSWSSEVRMWLIDNYKNQRSLITPSWETRQLLQAAYYDGPAGSLPFTNEGLELSQEGVPVTSFGSNPDGKGLLLRLWDEAGIEDTCQVLLPKGLKANKVQPCDLRGNFSGDAVAVENNRFTVPVKKYSPVSFLIETK